MKKVIPIMFAFILLANLFLLSAMSYPHGFYGIAQFTNGTDIPDGYILTGEVGNVTSGSCIISDGQYDLVVTGDINGSKVKFYIQGEEVDQTSEFIIWEITELDIEIDSILNEDNEFCGDDICNGDETCSDCPIDCDSCPIDDDDTPTNDDSSSGGNNNNRGGSGGYIPSSSSSSTTTPLSNPTTTVTNTQGNENVDLSSNENQPTGPGITGGVIGFVKSPTGAGLIIGSLLLIIGIVVVNLKKGKVVKKNPEKEVEE